MWRNLSSKLFGGKYQKRYPVCSDTLVYAIGDVHGCLGLLEGLIARIEQDAASRQDILANPAEVVLVGDLVDRGPNSSGVLECLSKLHQRPGLKPIFLTGNHEEMLLDFLDDPVRHKRWLRFGGLETMLKRFR